MKNTFALILFGVLVSAPGIEVAADDLVKPQPVKTFKLHAIGLGFKTTDMQSERIIPAPDHQATGVIINGEVFDSAFYYAELSPPITLPDSRYTWKGADDTFGSSAFVSYPNIGDKAIVLNVLDLNSNTVKFVGVLAKSRSVGSVSEASYCLTSGAVISLQCTVAFSDALLTTNWTNLPTTLSALGTNYAGDNGKDNAAKHAYWNLLMTRDEGSSVAFSIGTAHEYLSINGSGINANPGDAHNASVMDLDNNQRGRDIAASMTFSTTPATDDPAGQAAVIAADNAGTLTIMDDVNNPGRGGVLEPSNSPGTK